MLILAATTDKIQLVSSSTSALDVHCSFLDMSNADPPVTKGSTSSRQNTAISSATTTDIVASPASSTLRNVKTIHIRNKGAAANDVTVVFDQNGTDYELYKATLQAGEHLEYIEGIGWFVSRPSQTAEIYVKLTSDLSAFTSTTLADATGLLFSVTAGLYYKYKFMVIFQSAATTTGLKIGVTFPAVTIHAGTVHGHVSTAADGAANLWFGSLTTSGDSVVSTGTPAAATNYLCEVQGIIVPSASGSLQVQCATEIGASNITVKQGSMGSLETI